MSGIENLEGLGAALPQRSKDEPTENPKADAQADDEDDETKDPTVEIPAELLAQLNTSDPNFLAKLAQKIAGQASGHIDLLPPQVQKRVKAVQDLQAQYDDHLRAFEKEVEELEAKYQKLYEPVLAKRSAIVRGDIDADDATPGEGGEGEEMKGIPEFWLIAMKGALEFELSQQMDEEDLDKGDGPVIKKADEDVLKYLVDIRSEDLKPSEGSEDEEEEVGKGSFRLSFIFQPNPYFDHTTPESNGMSVLTKAYYMAKQELHDDVPQLQHAVATEIAWKPGKDVTKKKLKKKGKNGKVMTKMEDKESFFNFFESVHYPEIAMRDMDEEDAMALQEKMTDDYEMGDNIRSQLVARAYAWYSGEAQAEYMESDSEDEDDDDEDDEDEDEDDEDDDEDDDDDDEDDEDEDVEEIQLKPAKGKGKKKGGPPPAALGGKPQEGDPNNCPQQ
mmetsp:Transcript_12371/g.14816  ORF Transcript_12371/g.14816 Transcript_12371/m.14816 type:complete len:446 (+) Transcript_12371:113-1450(+)|eukprot:CAMPEP_0197850022 /NCGR_PEP_ID=MMETSP1438-20131217/13996_1 /TAXON_ID=1461541 /ORGANISM="Pterosperma sp., Strain CCMP1384" /LENGTH=445 /DNA_ID=CAMNT_0043462969 /DNA_START=99 /DNA_END=1436 /DNA_ORIENTATION=+